MKPDCQNVLTQFASFSVEELSDAEAAALLQHLEECEPCKGQWLLFEKTLTITTQSGPRDEDVSQSRSQEMWLVCLEHARQNLDKRAALPSLPHSAKVSRANSAEGCESKSIRSESSVLVAPRVGLTLLGGALLLLASAHWLTMHSAPAEKALPPMPTQLQTVGFESLPQRSVSLVDYGATLGFDAFSDHVEPTLISAPVKKARAATSVEMP